MEDLKPVNPEQIWEDFAANISISGFCALVFVVIASFAVAASIFFEVSEPRKFTLQIMTAILSLGCIFTLGLILKATNAPVMTNKRIVDYFKRHNLTADELLRFMIAHRSMSPREAAEFLFRNGYPVVKITGKKDDEAWSFVIYNDHVSENLRFHQILLQALKHVSSWNARATIVRWTSDKTTYELLNSDTDEGLTVAPL